MKGKILALSFPLEKNLKKMIFPFSKPLKQMRRRNMKIYLWKKQSKIFI